MYICIYIYTYVHLYIYMTESLCCTPETNTIFNSTKKKVQGKKRALKNAFLSLP